jgi:hypothetical protein
LSLPLPDWEGPQPLELAALAHPTNLTAYHIGRHPRLFAVTVVAYLIIISGLMILHGDSIEPEWLALALMLAAVALGAGKRFLKDWTPFVVLVLAYEAMRGLAAHSNFQPHDVGGLELWLWGGHLPTVTLQRLFYNPNTVGIQDKIATTVYFAHFLLPVGFGFMLWLSSREAYFRFTSSLLMLAFLAFLTYLLWPSSPPWFAHPAEVHKIMTEAMSKGGLARAASPIYSLFNPNRFAAFPSLHSAFPSLVAIHAWRRRRWLGVTLAAWTLVVWVCVVYLGEHYTVDALAGLAYAISATIVVDQVVAHRTKQPGLALASPRIS